MDLVEEDEAATAVLITAAATAAVAREVVITAAMAAVVTVAVTAVIMAAVTAVIPNLIVLTIINLLVQKVGKIEVMEILLKTLNMKVVEVEEKEAFQLKVTYQTKTISSPFLQALTLI